MKYTSTVLVSLAGTATAYGGHGHLFHERQVSGDPFSQMQCWEVQRWGSLVDLANNQTKLDRVSHGNTTIAAAIQAKAGMVQPKLAALEANATLMGTCNQIFAVQHMQHDCGKMLHMQHMAQIVTNQTALDLRTHGNTTKADLIKAKVAEHAPILSALETNGTLTSFCAYETTKETCISMKWMQGMVTMAANDTALANRFNTNQTKIDAFKAKAAEVKAQLDTLNGNRTLTGVCDRLKTTDGALASDLNGNELQGSAANVRPVGALVALIAVFVTGILTL